MGDFDDLRSGASLAAFNNNSVTISFPGSAVSGDLAIIFVEQAFNVSLPSGWTSLYASNGSVCNGLVASKVLDSTDITTGSVTVGFGLFGSYYGIAAIAVLIGAPTVAETVGYGSFVSFNSTPKTLSTGSSAAAGDTVLYFDSARANGSMTVNRGSLIQAATSADASGALYAEKLASGGVVTAIYSSAGGSSNGIQIATVVLGTAGAAVIQPIMQVIS